MHQAVELKVPDRDELLREFEAYCAGRRDARRGLPCRPPSLMEPALVPCYRRGWKAGIRAGQG